ncbi:MAG: PAS domain S-box protein [Gammaproteobacteria bacterium]|nr:PAS domain S-box protein [Gammaproteobacteria bacterium]
MDQAAKPRAGRLSGDASLLLPSSLSWTLLLYAALVLATGWAYSAQRIRTDRDETYQSESNRLRAVAVALEQSAFAMISDGVGAAVTRANEITAAGGLANVSDRDLSPELGKAMTGGQYVRSIFVADGSRFARAGRAGSYDVSRVPPKWFTALEASESQGSDVWIGTPIPDPDRPADATGEHMLVPIARRVASASNPDLWAGALFDFRAFDSLRPQLGGPGGIIFLVTMDGMLLAAMEDKPGHGLVGHNYASSPSFQEAKHYLASGWDSGTIEGASSVFGGRMVYGFAQLRQYPSLIVTARPLDLILSTWHERTVTTLVVTGAFSALVLAMTFLLSHSLRALRNREVHYRTLFNNTSFSVFLGEGDRFITANDTALRMFGLPDQEAVRALTPEQISPLEQPDGQPSALARRRRVEQAMRDGNASFEWQHRRVDTGELFPAEVDLSLLKEGKSNLTLAVVHDLTEAKRAEQQRHETEMRYQALVDAMPEAVLVHRGAELLFGNAAARTLIGAGPQQPLSAIQVTSLVLESDQQVMSERVRRILESGVASETRDTRIRRLDGSLIWVNLQGVRIEYGGAPAVQAVMHDITARKQQEEAEGARMVRMQRQSDALLRVSSRNSGSGWSGIDAALEGICADAAQVLGADRVAIWLLEEQGATLACAARYERGGAQHELPRFPMSRLGTYIGMLRTERVFRSADVTTEERLHGFSDATQPLASSRAIVAAAIWRAGELAGVVSASQLDGPRQWFADEANFVGGVADQVAQVLLDFEREQVLADLQVLAGELTRIQNEERRRIGRDLHDSTGQTLAALELDLARLSEAARSLAPKPRELLANAVRLARQCSTEIRTASYLLHPPLLDELGLVSALRWLADGLRDRSGIEVRLDLPEAMPRLSPANELTLFRVAQEALTNVQRHSASPWVAVRLTILAHTVSLEVEDAGRGIALRDPARGAAVPTLGVGLAGMRERIRQVGGTFAVESAGAGTRIRATVPLAALSEVRSA